MNQNFHLIIGPDASSELFVAFADETLATNLQLQEREAREGSANVPSSAAVNQELGPRRQ